MSTISVEVPVLQPAEKARVAPAAAIDNAPLVAGAAVRNPTLDAARVLAALGVVWLHVGESSPTFHNAAVFGRFGTSFFVFASIFLLLRQNAKPVESFPSYAAGRFRRLYVPFLAWSVIYIVAREINWLYFSGPQMFDLVPLRLLVGASGHFWFLPFILVIGLLCYPVCLVLPHLRRGKLPIAAFAIVIGAAIAFSVPPLTPASHEGAHLVRSVWTFLPGVFWAIAFSIICQSLPKQFTTSFWMALLGFTILVSSLTTMWLTNLHPVGRNLAGWGLLMVGLVPFQLPVVTRLAPMGRCSFGIYLAHPLIIALLRSFTHIIGLAPRWWIDLMVIAAGFLGSYLLTRLLRANKWTAWLIP